MLLITKHKNVNAKVLQKSNEKKRSTLYVFNYIYKAKSTSKTLSMKRELIRQKDKQRQIDRQTDNHIQPTPQNWLKIYISFIITGFKITRLIQ